MKDSWSLSPSSEKSKQVISCDMSEKSITADDFLAQLEEEFEPMDQLRSEQSLFSGSIIPRVRIPGESDSVPKRRKLDHDEKGWGVEDTVVSMTQCHSSFVSDDAESSGIEDAFSSPERVSPAPIQPYVTKKSLFERPFYDPAVLDLFRHRENVWVNHVKRKTALDMWEDPKPMGASEVVAQDCEQSEPRDTQE